MRNALRTPFAILLALLLSGPVAFASDAFISHLFHLSDLTGTVPYSDVVLHADKFRDEMYVAAGNQVRVFNAAGMEVYRFDLDPEIGRLMALVAEESGDLVLLTYEPLGSRAERPWFLTRCDYRGVPLERIDVTGLPEELASFTPELMFLHDSRFILANGGSKHVAVTDSDGTFERSYDLAALIGMDNPANNDIFGMDVDRDGNMLFTIAVKFKAYIVSPEGDVRVFGRKGSSPGSFGIAAGITADGDGNVLVADKLRGVVMLFDESLQFVEEFGNEGGSIALSRPTDLASNNSGKIFVTQSRKRGVSVFGVSTPRDDNANHTASAPEGGDGQQNSETILANLEQATESATAPARPNGNQKSNGITLRAGTTPAGSSEPGVAELPEQTLEELKP